MHIQLAEYPVRDNVLIIEIGFVWMDTANETALSGTDVTFESVGSDRVIVLNKYRKLINTFGFLVLEHPFNL